MLFFQTGVAATGSYHADKHRTWKTTQQTLRLNAEPENFTFKTLPGPTHRRRKPCKLLRKRRLVGEQVWGITLDSKMLNLAAPNPESYTKPKPPGCFGVWEAAQKT